MVVINAVVGVLITEHVTPSPVNPELQAHEKLPAVLVHVALSAQLSASVVHSSISEINDVELNLF